MKKRPVDDEDFRKTENESRLKRFNDDHEDYNLFPRNSDIHIIHGIICFMTSVLNHY